MPCPDAGDEVVAGLAADLLAGKAGADLTAGLVAVLTGPDLASALTALAGTLAAGLLVVCSAGNRDPEADDVAAGLVAEPVAGRATELVVTDVEAGDLLVAGAAELAAPDTGVPAVLVALPVSLLGSADLA